MKHTISGLAAVALAVSLLLAGAPADARDRHRNGRPFEYINAARPARSTSTRRVTYYSARSPAYYRSTASYRRLRQRRYQTRVAGYRRFSTAASPRWYNGRRLGWRGRPVPPGRWRRYQR